MIYRLRIISDEVKDFAREILVDCKHTFLDFHNALQENLRYDSGQITSFFITNEHWEKELQITLIDMMDDESNSVITMDTAEVGDYLKKKGQRMLYVFDFFSERSFFIELTEVITAPHNNKIPPKIVFEHGNPPDQINLGIEDLNFSDEDLDVSTGSDEDFLSDLNIDDLEDYPMTKTLAIIAGPTASGKTQAGIALAKKFHAEIISADSRQIYKETNIGTAVPSPAELKEVPHHFIQCISLDDYYNASMYEQEVLSRLDQLFTAHDIVFMVGGSGLYINAVCTGIDDLPTINDDVRNEMAALLENKGLQHLQDMLQRVDPQTYDNIDLQNHYRVLKALEVHRQTGKPYSSFLTHHEKKRDFNIIRIALNDDREALYNRINSRVEKMVDAGLVQEVKGLGRFRNNNAMKTVGYREIFGYLDGQHSLDEAIDLIKRNTRKYARKQITWFRKNNLYRWFPPEEYRLMEKYIVERMRE